ncbi:cytidylyltransferase domain-containing protein [Methanococcoides burtonii]|uniref:N-acylneuraminate cytidylyltransferase n=1 Tax=Methanococcoides burtonii (strain DSM 6242 / NBRC 107633 / OCM 468 / ACE-M) TaxID=259564 RepID=Q12VM8_METBU|nr:acylneuraminate cytidylyltransferase family protein [Methanococcoides burtonii]ABE52498.1 N-acylneuraminate cytidylyltransferase [Methanococcoides burtonii DSM 6242]
MTNSGLNSQKYQKLKILALLPMKGNSQRVPNKNMKLFAGNPLYHAILDELLESKYISKIVVNTDSETIKNDVSKNYYDSVIVINRPNELCGDFVSMNELIKYDIDQVDYQYFIQTHSTNPLLKAQTIDEAIIKYIKSLATYDSLFSVTKLQTRLYDENGEAVNHNPDELIRTQDLEPLYEENSNIYIFSKESFKKAGNKRIGSHPQMFEVNKLEAIDIDEPEDFELAELLYKKRRCLL